MAQYAAMPIKIIIKILNRCLLSEVFLIFIEKQTRGISNYGLHFCQSMSSYMYELIILVQFNEKKNPVRSTSAISRTRYSTDSVNTFPSIPRDVWTQAMSHQMHLVVGQVSYIVQLFDKASDGGPDHSGISRSLNVVYVVCAFRPIHSDNIHIGLQ